MDFQLMFHGFPVDVIHRGASYLMKRAKQQGRDAHFVCDSGDAKCGTAGASAPG